MEQLKLKDDIQSNIKDSLNKFKSEDELAKINYPDKVSFNILNLFHNSKKLDNLINFYYFIQI